jgi:hypothetical protein
MDPSLPDADLGSFLRALVTADALQVLYLSKHVRARQLTALKRTCLHEQRWNMERAHFPLKRAHAMSAAR